MLSVKSTNTIWFSKPPYSNFKASPIEQVNFMRLFGRETLFFQGKFDQGEIEKQCIRLEEHWNKMLPNIIPDANMKIQICGSQYGSNERTQLTLWAPIVALFFDSLEDQVKFVLTHGISLE